MPVAIRYLGMGEQLTCHDLVRDAREQSTVRLDETWSIGVGRVEVEGSV